MDQIIIACDDKGVPTGEYIPKIEGHTGKGRRHLAICVLLENSQGEVLLQRRKHKIFDNIWDVSGATNNLHIEEKDESFIEATQRCLKEEYEIDGVELKVLGSFNYFAQYGELCENEFCKLLVGIYNGEIKLNPEVGYSYKWISKKDFLNELKKHPKEFTPWCKEAVKILKEKDFFK